MGISRTIKNVSRFREIISILARNGFDELIIKSGLHDKIAKFPLPKSKFERSLVDIENRGGWSWSIGNRLRLSFEELGPGFIKLGQILGTREDLFEPDFIDQMKQLQDNVREIPFEKSLEIIEASLEKKWNEVFTEIDEIPIGKASIGMVYSGKLLNGQQVVIKVRRPEIIHNIKSDFEILEFIVNQVEKVSPDIKYLGISRAIQDLASSLIMELNFHREAHNRKILSENFAKHDINKRIHLPEIYEEYSSDSILVMEKIIGIPFNRSSEISSRIKEVEELLEDSILVLIKSMFVDGFFHADLHGGNFFLMEDNIGLIDFGICGTFSLKNRLSLVAILHSLTTHNYENLVYEIIDVAEFEHLPDIDALIKDTKLALSPYTGLTIGQINLPEVMTSALRVFTKNRIFLPSEWLLVLRTIVTLDGVGKSIRVDLDILNLVNESIKPIIKDMASKDQLIEQAAWLTKDVYSAVRIIPRHLKWFIKDFTNKKYALEINQSGYSNDLNLIARSIGFLGMCIISAVGLGAGAWIINSTKIYDFNYFPQIVWILWGVSIASFLTGVMLWRGKS